MKKRSFVVLSLIALFLVAGVAFVQAAGKVDLNGKWTLMVHAPAGSGMPTFILKQTGDKLTGNYSGFYGEAPLTGTVSGNDFEWQFDLSGITRSLHDSLITGTRDLHRLAITILGSLVL